MAATRQDISDWFDEGVRTRATHMIVVCDEFDMDDYPIYVSSGQNVREVSKKYADTSLQRVMEVYALHMDKSSQLREWRAFHYESANATSSSG